MNSRQVGLVQGSFATLAPHAEEAASAFYERVFAIDPTLRPLFRGNMAEQRRKLMTTLATTLQALRQMEAVVPTLHALGRRHATYGVQETHYAVVGAALLATLKSQLGEAFTAEVEAAWTACFDFVAGTMQDGARDAAPSLAA